MFYLELTWDKDTLFHERKEVTLNKLVLKVPVRPSLCLSNKSNHLRQSFVCVRAIHKILNEMKIVDEIIECNR